MRYVTLVLATALIATAGPVLAQDDAWPASVLITNDDGIDDPGLRALAQAFASVTKTYVVAPMENKSGSTSYVSALSTRRLEGESRDLGGGIVAYAVDGYPADAVVLALGGLLDERPALVISGVNGGPNLSADWSLSGTVGAARIAALLGVPAIAVSGYTTEQPETLAAVAAWVAELARSPLVRGMEPGDYLTVSVPRVPVSEIQGISIVSRSARNWELGFERSPEPASASGRESWQLTFSRRQVTLEPGTDVPVYQANRIAIVPMHVNEHDYELLEELMNSSAGVPAWPGAAER